MRVHLTPTLAITQLRTSPKSDTSHRPLGFFNRFRKFAFKANFRENEYPALLYFSKSHDKNATLDHNQVLVGNGSALIALHRCINVACMFAG